MIKCIVKFFKAIKFLLEFLTQISYRSIPKTIYFNFKYLDFKTALKLPIHVYHRVEFKVLQGSVSLKSKPGFAAVLIGFPDKNFYSKKTVRSVWKVKGKVVFGAGVFIGAGTVIDVAEKGELDFGSNFYIAADNTIRCHKKIQFGNDCLLSWENLFMDTDFHSIYAMGTETAINQPKAIIIGDKVWIGCRCTFVKGARVGNGCVVGAHSLVSKEFKDNNVMIGGNPARIIKDKIRWEN